MAIWIKKVFAQLLFWLYEFLDAIFEMFRVLCGIDAVEYTENGETVSRSIIEIFLESSPVTKAFLMIFLVAIVVCAISVIVTVVKNIVNLKGGQTKDHAKTVGQGFGSILVTLVLAFITVFGIWGSNEVLGKVYEATSTDPNLSISGRLFDMSVTSSYVYDLSKPLPREVQATDENGNLLWETKDGGTTTNDQEAVIDPETNNPKKVMITETYYDYKRDPITQEYVKEGGWQNDKNGVQYTAADIDFKMSVDEVFGKHKTNLIGLEKEDSGYDIMPMVNLDSFNFLMGYFVVVMMLIALIWSMLGLVKRIFDIVVLFIMLPLISATIPLDDGARLKMWRETLISKVVLAYGAVISVNVFLLVIPVIQNINFASIGWSSFGSSLFKMFMLIGGALCINGGQLLISRILGTSADESREMAQSARALISGGAAAGAMLHGVKNAIFGGKNKYGRETNGALKSLSGAAGKVGNAAGNILGGQAYRSAAGSVADKIGGMKDRLSGLGSYKRSNGGSVASAGVGGSENAMAASQQVAQANTNNGVGGALVNPSVSIASVGNDTGVQQADGADNQAFAGGKESVFKNGLIGASLHGVKTAAKKVARSQPVQMLKLVSDLRKQFGSRNSTSKGKNGVRIKSGGNSAFKPTKRK